MRCRVACHLATNTLALIVGVFICSSYLQASTPNPILSNLAPNTAKYLGPYTCTAVAGEPQTWCKIVHDYSGMVYDPNRHQMVIFGGGHASTNYDAINTFNLDSLKWVEEYLPTPCSSISPENYDRTNGAWRSGPSGPYARPAARHTEDLMVVVGDELVLLASVEGNGPCSPWNFPEPYNSYELTGIHRIAHYNFITKTWTFTTAQADDHKWPGAAYDPVSKKILMVGQNGLDVYDPASKTRYRPIEVVQYFSDSLGCLPRFAAGRAATRVFWLD